MSGKRKAYRLQVSSGFSSSHQLRHYLGQCEELHGHNFAVQIEVQGYQLHPETEILIDFKELKSELNAILQELDHKHLNDLPYFREHNPSSENLACHIYQRLQSRLQNKDIVLRWVSVSEKDSSRAVYLED